MRSWQQVGLALLAVGLIAAQGCSFLSSGGGGSNGLRPTNVELYIVSQSCFQGEVVPCG